MFNSRRRFLQIGLVGAGMLSLTARAAMADSGAGGPGKTTLTADQALARLQEGNRRFAADLPNLSDISQHRRHAVAHGQGPFAAIVSCADSRVGPEHLFEAGLGDLFVVRTAGNYLDTAGRGSIEYAVANLGVPLIVVLGHERCGAVGAAVDVVTKNAQLPGTLGPMVEPILPAVVQARTAMKPGEDLLYSSVRANVSRVTQRLRTASEPLLQEPIRSGKVRVVGAAYELDSGVVDIFDLG